MVDVQKEYIAVKEANRLNIPVFAMVDTCCDPSSIDFVIPANDDATRSIEVVVGEMVAAIREGIMERRMERANAANEQHANEDAEEAEEEGSKPRKIEDDEDEE